MILLDTHVLVWWVSTQEGQLSKAAKRAISADLSVGEIEAVRFVPVDNQVAVKSPELPGEFHKDPADRMIVATARRFAAPLVTADEKIRGYPHVKTIW